MDPRPAITRSPQRLLALIATVALAATACATSGQDERSSPVGWIDGSPAAADAASAPGGASEDIAAGSGSGVGESRALEGDATAETTVAPGDVPAPAAGLRAGSVDDNADFAGYLEYLERTAGLGIAARPLDVSVRHVVAVSGDDGRPVLGEPVEVLAGDEVVGVVRTGADGRALVHPRALDVGDDRPVQLRVAGDTREPAAEVTSFELDRPGGVAGAVPLDLFFVLDATGSMVDELARLTATVDTVAGRIAELDGDPDVRLGMTVYRDEGDAFVTRTFDFTGDVAAFRAALAEVGADGGGDTPEALDEALGAALEEPSWRDPADAVQLVVAVTDAGAQVERDVPTPYDVSLRRAAERGIRIHSVGTSGSDDAAEYVLRQFAQFTGGRFVFLSYGVDGAALGPGTDIASVDYEELPLDELLVRLVAEELAQLTGGDPAPPTTTPPATTTTTDPGQQQPG